MNASVGGRSTDLGKIFGKLPCRLILHPGSAVKTEALGRLRAPFQLRSKGEPASAKDPDHFGLLVLEKSHGAALVDRDLIAEGVLAKGRRESRLIRVVGFAHCYAVGFEKIFLV